jgi:peptide/nickel transport system substrate-binding protein
MRRFTALGVYLGMALFLSAPSARAADQPKRGGTLTMAISRDMVRMNPMIRTASTEKRVRDLIYDALLREDRKGNMQPGLAEAWEISNDGKLYTFKLRKGVKFHNGQEMTTQDVKFSMDYTRNKKNGAYGFGRLEVVDRIETPDAYTLNVYLKQANAPFLSSLTDIRSFPVIPKESLPEGVEKPTKFPPGTGPFKFVEWVPSQRIVFERFGDYWGQKPFVDKVILRPIENETVRFTALRAGDVDIVERTPYEWVKQIVDGKIKGIGFAKAETAGYRRIMFNVDAPPFNNKKLREAVAYAINKKELLEAAYMGFGDVTDQKYPKGYAWCFDEIASPKFDLNKAKALIKESGYKGQAVRFLTSQEGVRQTEALMVQSQLAKIGMNIKIDTVEWGAYRIQQRKGDYDFMFYGGQLDTDPSITYSRDWVCESKKKRSSNVSGYCDPKVDALFHEAEGAFKLEKRKKLFKEILEKVYGEIPDIPVGYVPRFFAFRKEVKGFSTNGSGDFRFADGGLAYAWLDR